MKSWADWFQYPRTIYRKLRRDRVRARLRWLEAETKRHEAMERQAARLRRKGVVLANRGPRHYATHVYQGASRIQ